MITKRQFRARAAPQGGPGRSPPSMEKATADEMVAAAKEHGTRWFKGHIQHFRALAVEIDGQARPAARRPAFFWRFVACRPSRLGRASRHSPGRTPVAHTPRPACRWFTARPSPGSRPSR